MADPARDLTDTATDEAKGVPTLTDTGAKLTDTGAVSVISGAGLADAED